MVLLSAAVAVAVYLQTLHYSFVSDDELYIIENTKLAGLHFSELWRLFAEPYNPVEFLPLRDLSYWFDIKLFGPNPTAFRLHNIILYLLCLPLVYATTRGLWRYFRPAHAADASWAAAAVTVLFVLHPAHVEAVVWISGRKDLLSGLFSLFALWLAMNAKREQGLSPEYASAALLALLAAMLSKATAVTVAPLIALLWILFWRDIPKLNRRRTQLLWPVASLLLVMCAVLIFAANSVPTVKAPVFFGSEIITRALAILGWLTRLVFSPESRHFFYPVLDVTYIPIMVISGIVVLLAAISGVVMIARRRSLEGFALVTFLLLCMPYTQLVPYYTTSLVSDRFLFLAVWPGMLLIVALAWYLSHVPRTALLLLLALPWSFQMVTRADDWQNFEAIIDGDLRGFPGYFMPAMYKIGTIQLKNGAFREAANTANTITGPEFRNIMVEIVQADYVVRIKTPATGQPQEAMALLWQLGTDLRQEPIQARWNSPVNIFWTRSQETFANEWALLIKQFPEDASVRYNFGLWKLEVHNYPDAVTHLRAATESQRLPVSQRGIAFRNLGIALLSSGRAAEAEAPLRAALAQSPPEQSAYCTLREVYQQTHRLEEAASAEAECRSHMPGAGVAR
ncbi:MAG: tetratricopeptide repeat protein [Gallionella sp.]